MKQFSVVIPVYNEGKMIQETISDIKNCLEPNYADNYEIIVVDDCSTDGIKIDNELVIRHPVNKGYGAALKTGIKHSKYDWIIIIDADGTYPVKSIPEFIKYAGEYDLITGHRKIAGKGVPLERKFAKFFLNKVAGYLAGSKIPDINSGLRMFKKEIVLKYWDLFPDRFSFTSTLTMICLCHGYPTKFVPIDYYKRTGKSTLRATSFFSFLKLVAKLALFFKPIKVFLPASLILFLAAALIAAAYIFDITQIFFDTIFIVLCATALQTLFFGLLAEVIIYSRSK